MEEARNSRNKRNSCGGANGQNQNPSLFPLYSDGYKERVLKRIRTAPVKTPPPLPIELQIVEVRSLIPNLTDWDDLSPGARKCYFLFKFDKDEEIVYLATQVFTSLTGRVTLMLLAYNLKDANGVNCFHFVSPELITEDAEIEFDEISDSHLLTEINPNNFTVEVDPEDPNYYSKLAKGFSYLAASYMRLYTKPCSDYARIGEHLRTRFADFYDFPFPFGNFQLTDNVVWKIKNQFELDSILRNTFYNFLYAGENYRCGAELKEFLYGVHTAYTGMHAYTLFLKCMDAHKVSNDVLAHSLKRNLVFEWELESIDKIFDSLFDSKTVAGKEKQMWKYGRIFDNSFFRDLQTKRCPLFIASLANLYHKVVPMQGNQNATKIAGIRDMTNEQKLMASRIADLAFKKIKDHKNSENSCLTGEESSSKRSRISP